MICKNCRREIADKSKFCAVCGIKIEPEAVPFCAKCGKPYDSDAKFCKNCGTPRFATKAVKAPAEQGVVKTVKTSVFLPSFILGLIGSIFGIFGGLYLAMFQSIFSGAAGISAIFLVFLGSVLGLVGSCLCLSKSIIGSVIDILSAVMMIIHTFSFGAGILTILAWLLLMVSGIVGLLCSSHKE